MMLDHMGYEELGAHLMKAIEETTASGIKTPDIGGKTTTAEVIDEVLKCLAPNC